MQMGGKGNAQAILDILYKLIQSKAWKSYFIDFSFPYAFYSPAEYKNWINQIGFKERRIELIPKDMIHENRDDLAGWIRTTWLPYTQRIPEHDREDFINQLVEDYIIAHGCDIADHIHVSMSRLEVEIEKP